MKRCSFIFEELQKAKEEKEITYTEEYHLAENDLFKSIINQYQLEVEAGMQLYNRK